MAPKGKYLVIGANGFIGSYLVDALVSVSGVTVRAFDRFSREPSFTKSDNIEAVRGNALDANDIKKAVSGVDYVIHCFSSTTPFISDKDPYKDIDENLKNGVKIFEICAQNGVKKIGYISSAGTVYGRQSEYGVSTELDVPLPVSPYGINKLALEYYLEYFKRQHNMPYVIWRLTNPFGPRQFTKNNQGVVPNFIDKINNGEELIIYGDGTTSRDYIFAEDAVKMMLATFAANNKYPVYNIGRGKQTSLTELIDTLSKIMKTNPAKRNIDAPKTFLIHSSVSIERYSAEFGQPVFMTLEDGLRKTIASHVTSVIPEE